MPVYNTAKKKIIDGDIDFLADTLKVALVQSTYTPDIDSDEFWSTPDGYEVASGGGYTTGGTTLAGKTSVVDTGADFAYLDATDITWANATFTARYAVLYKWTGDAATSPLIAYWDFGSDRSVAGIDFVIFWNSLGVLNLY